MGTKGKRLYYIALVAFSLCSILPLLIFVYVLFEKGVLNYTLAAVFTASGLALAVLGYLFLRESYTVISRLAKNLTQRAEHGDAAPEAEEEIQGRVMEADEILEAFQKTVGRLESSVERMDRLTSQFMIIGELVHVASCSLEPNEMIRHFLEKIIHTTAAEWGVVLCMEGEDELKEMIALPEMEISRGLRQRLHFNTLRVLKMNNPYLGCNFSTMMGSPANGEMGPLISWPITIRGDVGAVLHLGRSHGSPTFRDTEFRALRPAGELLGLALDNLRRLRSSRVFATPMAADLGPRRADEEEEPLVDRSILVVDDEPVVRNVISNFLVGKGYKVLSASSGEEALARIHEERPCLVLINLNLKDMDGLEVLKRVHEELPGTGVVVITEMADETVFEETLALGAFDYLVKPIDFNYLENVLMIKMARR